MYSVITDSLIPGANVPSSANKIPEVTVNNPANFSPIAPTDSRQLFFKFVSQGIRFSSRSVFAASIFFLIFAAH